MRPLGSLITSTLPFKAKPCQRTEAFCGCCAHACDAEPSLSASGNHEEAAEKPQTARHPEIDAGVILWYSFCESPMRKALQKSPSETSARRSVAGLTVAFVLLAVFPTQALSRTIDGIAIVVNKDAVLVSEVNAAMMPTVQEYRKKYSGDELKKKLADLRETVVNQAIETRLILQVAKANDITPDDKAVDSRIAIIKKRFPSEEEFVKALAAKGMTLREYREQVVEQVLVQDTTRMVLGREISVQDDEIEAYYEDHHDEFETEPRVELAQIFLKIPGDGTDEEIEEIRKKADQLRLLLDDGADFSELAGKYSEGPYREKGGLLGAIGPEEILPELEKIAFALETDEISTVVRTAYGFHILKAIEARPARKIGFDEATPLIEESIREEKRSEKYDDWIDKLKEDSYIDIRI